MCVPWPFLVCRHSGLLLLLCMVAHGFMCCFVVVIWVGVMVADGVPLAWSFFALLCLGSVLCALCHVSMMSCSVFVPFLFADGMACLLACIPILHKQVCVSYCKTVCVCMYVHVFASTVGSLPPWTGLFVHD